jgi:UDP-sulfoquinovose synthase
MQCLYLAASNPAQEGELRIFNQFVETFSVNKLAEMVKRVGDTRGHGVNLNHIENPRIELEEHYYNPKHTGLEALGLKPNPLNDAIVNSMFNIVEKYKANINKDAFFKGVKWR